MRARDIVLVTVLGSIGAAACGSKPKPKPIPVVVPVKAEITGLVFDVEPADAEVEIDGSMHGPAGQLPSTVELPPGAHQIIIRKEGFQTWRGEVEITARTERIQVRLVAGK